MLLKNYIITVAKKHFTNVCWRFAKKKRELSEIQYASAAEIQRNATIELHKCRLKMANLRKVVDITEPEYGQLFEDLLKELEERITDFANKRKVRRPL